MPTQTGTHDINWLLASRYQSVMDLDMDAVVAVLRADLAAHNALMLDLLGEFADVTTERQLTYGGGVGGEMVQVDEYGRAPTQRAPSTAATIGLPLHKYQFALGWTETALRVRTAADIATAQLNAEGAHRRAVQRDIKRALFLSSNYTHVDYLVDGVSLSVKRLINADSSLIPAGPNGESFDGATHTHYDFNNGLSAAAVTAAINDVVEHGWGSQVRVAIARANETAFRALTGFTAYQDPRLVFGASTTGVPDTRLDLTRMDNRAIGLFGAAEVWVKPWVPTDYLVAYDAGATDKPLAFRQREQTALQGLRIAATLSAFPLVAEYMEVEYGIGVRNRTAASVLYFAAGAVAYVDPTIS